MAFWKMYVDRTPVPLDLGKAHWATIANKTATRRVALGETPRPLAVALKDRRVAESIRADLISELRTSNPIGFMEGFWVVAVDIDRGDGGRLDSIVLIPPVLFSNLRGERVLADIARFAGLGDVLANIGVKPVTPPSGTVTLEPVGPPSKDQLNQMYVVAHIDHDDIDIILRSESEKDRENERQDADHGEPPDDGSKNTENEDKDGADSPGDETTGAGEQICHECGEGEFTLKDIVSLSDSMLRRVGQAYVTASTRPKTSAMLLGSDIVFYPS